MTTYDEWKTTEPDNAASPAHLYDNGYEDGWQHGYQSALHDAQMAVSALLQTITAYGNMDCDIVHIDEAMDAIRELARAKP